MGIKPNSIGLSKVTAKTYLHQYARTLSAIANESSKAKSETWPDTRHKE